MAFDVRDFGFVEPLLFEQGAKGRCGASLPYNDFEAVDALNYYGKLARATPAALPELSEPEVVRHYVRLSRGNFAIDTGMVPLGSCTMKYNPKVNEWAARLAGFAQLHPYSPEQHIQGALLLMHQLERSLAEICGMDHVSLQPAAGAQGELTGLMMIRSYHQDRGRSPKKVLIPDTAHGTNPASCALSGLEATPFVVGDSGIITAESMAPYIDDDVAAIMLTNPNTVGLFETHLHEVADLVHERGGLVYGDGANLNAIMGKTRPGDFGVDIMQFNLHKTFTTPHGGGGPGSGPVAFKSPLRDFAPLPVLLSSEERGYYFDYDRPRSIGRVRSFFGNFGMMVRAYAYIREMGSLGLSRATELAVLNANYLRACMARTWTVAFNQLCMHEFLASDKHLRPTGVTTLDIAKRLMDYGFHAPTVYWPLVVKGAMLIEPTETESKDTLDRFVSAMEEISEQANKDAAVLKSAPHTTRLRRLNETQAARQPRLRWRAVAPDASGV
ncbi:MAG: aminomethyl-transferring glycine dehydrogenase subunit GcvPB [Myxococcales bacterium]|nr:aminomethyl-transferring glycine dehydrogenase subunit GcvPB [Myxococcales bacterium]MCB9707582.1 aminomethyl-transferring glycine dehydrogenase subunit GcvPB [Myxococcales bacterium]